jgi:hypothetical protein
LSAQMEKSNLLILAWLNMYVDSFIFSQEVCVFVHVYRSIIGTSFTTALACY